MKKIFNTVARRATLLAAVMLAAFSFSLSSCSDDDDDDPKPDTPETTDPQLENIAWFDFEDDNITPDLESFVYIDGSNNMYFGFYMCDEDEVDWAHENIGEENIALYDLVFASKAPLPLSITKTSETTGTLAIGPMTSQYTLSKDGVYLTTVEKDGDQTYTTTKVNIKALGYKIGKTWDFSDRDDIEW